MTNRLKQDKTIDRQHYTASLNIFTLSVNSLTALGESIVWQVSLHSSDGSRGKSIGRGKMSNIIVGKRLGDIKQHGKSSTAPMKHWRRRHGDDEGPSGSDPAPRSSTALVEFLDVVEATGAAGDSDPAIRRTRCVAVRGSLVGFGNGFAVEVDDGFAGFCACAGATTGFVVDGPAVQLSVD